MKHRMQHFPAAAAFFAACGASAAATSPECGVAAIRAAPGVPFLVPGLRRKSADGTDFLCSSTDGRPALPGTESVQRLQ